MLNGLVFWEWAEWALVGVPVVMKLAKFMVFKGNGFGIVGF